MEQRGGVAHAVLVGLLGVVLGCDRCDDESATSHRTAEQSDDKGGGPPETGEGSDHPSSRERSDLAVVEGVVRLSAEAGLPAYSPETVRRSSKAERPEECPPPKKTERHPLLLGADRGLSNVLVSITGFDESPPHEPAQHTVVIRNCRLQPSVVAATVGDRLVIKAQKAHGYLPTLGSSHFHRVLLPGQPRKLELGNVGVQSLSCTTGIPCGRTEVIVQAHPVHTLTVENGKFSIGNVPPGELTAHAWHPLLQEASTSVSVKPGASTEVVLSVTPASPSAN